MKKYLSLFFVLVAGCHGLWAMENNNQISTMLEELEEREKELTMLRRQCVKRVEEYIVNNLVKNLVNGSTPKVDTQKFPELKTICGEVDNLTSLCRILDAQQGNKSFNLFQFTQLFKSLGVFFRAQKIPLDDPKVFSINEGLLKRFCSCAVETFDFGNAFCNCRGITWIGKEKLGVKPLYLDIKKILEELPGISASLALKLDTVKKFKDLIENKFKPLDKYGHFDSMPWNPKELAQKASELEMEFEREIKIGLDVLL